MRNDSIAEGPAGAARPCRRCDTALPAEADPARILAFATKGAGSNEEARLRTLLDGHTVEWFPFDRAHKFRSFRQITRLLKSRRFQLAVMEGTGLAGGLALIWSRLLGRCRYVVSSGDAVGPWVRSIRPMLGWLFTVYEKLLCRLAAGFIGWTPYLVGRAMTFGCGRAMTAPGFALHPRSPEQLAAARARIRAQLGIDENTIVFGILGSLAYNRRVDFCYGAELVHALRQTDRRDIAVLIVGDGDGRQVLIQLAGDRVNTSVLLPGPVPNDQVLDYMAAMDLASLPQSVDGVGAFRYTTKISEYVAARLPVITNQIPLAYDFDSGWIVRLPGESPWDPRFISALAQLMQHTTRQQIDEYRSRLPAALEAFDAEQQVRRVTGFIQDLLDCR